MTTVSSIVSVDPPCKKRFLLIYLFARAVPVRGESNPWKHGRVVMAIGLSPAGVYTA